MRSGLLSWSALPLCTQFWRSIPGAEAARSTWLQTFLSCAQNHRHLLRRTRFWHLQARRHLQILLCFQCGESKFCLYYLDQPISNHLHLIPLWEVWLETVHHQHRYLQSRAPSNCLSLAIPDYSPTLLERPQQPSNCSAGPSQPLLH